MRRVLPRLLLAAVLLGGCGGGTPEAAPRPASPSAAGYSAEVRENFLRSCVENATKTADGAATQEQLTATCECILGTVEEELSETEFAAFEERLLSGEATEAENAQLGEWSTDCAEEATG